MILDKLTLMLTTLLRCYVHGTALNTIIIYLIQRSQLRVLRKHILVIKTKGQRLCYRNEEYELQRTQISQRIKCEKYRLFLEMSEDLFVSNA